MRPAFARIVAAVGISGLVLVCGACGGSHSRLPQVAQTDATPAGDRLVRVDRSSAALEYRISRDEAHLRAPNPRHAFDSYIGPQGIRLVDRAGGGSELLVMTLERVGRAERLRAVPEGELHSTGNRVEIERPGIREWYENGPNGLEQGFTLAEKPSGEEPLRLELRLRGVQLAMNGDRLTLVAPSGRKLAYDHLAVWDSTGERVEARLGADEDRITITVDDDSARYPITIDPLLSALPDAVIESDHEGEGLGRYVASAGDVNGDGFDDLLVVSLSPNSVFVFHGSPAGIAHTNIATANARIEEADGAGIAASAGDINGDGYSDIVIGKTNYSGGETSEGAAFLFLGSPTGIASGDLSTADARLEADQAGAAMGRSVASAGDVNDDGFSDVIIGARRYDSGETNEGAAFVFLGSAAGIASGSAASAHARLESNQASSEWGDAVSSAGDVNGDGFSDVIIGAPRYYNGESSEGAAFVFLGSSAGIANGNPSTAWGIVERDAPFASLGSDVASAGDTNADGFGDVVVASGWGACFVYLGDSGGLTGPALNVAGHYISSAGDVDDDGEDDVVVGGANFAKIYFSGGVANVAPLSGAPTTSGAFGTSVAFADVNGDGFSDVLVGDYLHSNGQLREGAAFVYHGSALPEPGVLTGLAAGALALSWLDRRARSIQRNSVDR